MRCECGWKHMEKRRATAKIRDALLRAAVWEHWYDIDAKENKVDLSEKSY
jgi:heterodisulfide reductase subunit A-like polyferredoxin